MSQKSDQISAVPSNIITGFLGVGKTSTILQLLKTKPAHERWAVLVNEFGEIGIDGSVFESQHSEQHGVYIREVPGGCMCCTAGVPMQVALAQLLRRAKPDRLLIEPTGLGHPTEVLQTLNDQTFKDALDIQNVITVVDARQLSDKRYVEHETFQQQIAIADVIVANKSDLYDQHDQSKLEDYLQRKSLTGLPLIFTQQGVIQHGLLDGRREQGARNLSSNLRIDGLADREPQFEQPMSEGGYIKALNNGEGFVSIGWRFAEHCIFDKERLFTFLSGVDAERLKATFITDQGCFAYNLTKDAISEVELEGFEESRIEIIARELDDKWEAALFDSLITSLSN